MVLIKCRIGVNCQKMSYKKRFFVRIQKKTCMSNELDLIVKLIFVLNKHFQFSFFMAEAKIYKIETNILKKEIDGQSSTPTCLPLAKCLFQSIWPHVLSLGLMAPRAPTTPFLFAHCHGQG